MSFSSRRIFHALEAHGPFARIVIAKTRGSAPRETGTDMFVWSDRIDGTIGGGALEWRAMAVAREVLESGVPKVLRLPLGPALNQCCGGAVTLVIERIDAVPPKDWVRRIEGDAPEPSRPALGLKSGWMREKSTRTGWRVNVWGAGHVGRALVDVLHPLPDFAVVWYDIAKARFPAAPPVMHVVSTDLPRNMASCATTDDHLIVTHSHDLDLALCHAALTWGFGRCGLIGSATKWARFQSRLRDLGHSDDAIARIDCPIGDPTLGKHPQAIAVGVAARLLSAGPPEGTP
ncbi:xanthine dehydrogenase accessory protein XdhC [Jannaschia seohaensis]|uniref:Xanthine dehydrogenase accessory factor n=1 Tax=Jannaschia seohaensis TaxID=475081 RepID=A0A2Y9C3Q4_9RHOB|nr:xanthine dehydrogenase accessory protein XdhC [Jannaschia seohaensis]PWJ21945.1 xanthine dehydrogenase accessory factor [Jannaschia seohaensis]SSA38223.1 xanthine dehydrogenase accessory factor [Jannaschia seohaensis]